MKIETRYNIAIVVAVAAIVAAFAASAAPTANEDYVDRQDAQTYTNAVTDANAHADVAAGAALSAANAHADAEIIAATGAIRKVDGAAKLLPRYLWALDFEDAYTNDAAWYYARENYQGGGHCSARRTGNLVERNFDWKFDRMAEVIVRMVAGPGRFASVGVANVGTNLTEDAITSGAHSRYFKCLPGHTVDGVNENGVVIEVNVTGGTWPRTSGAVHGLGAVRWALDHATNAQHAAEYLAANVYLPDGFGVNFHYLIADAEKTYIVENGEAIPMTGSPVVMTNFNLGEDGEGLERYRSLTNGASMVSQWWTAAYNRNTRPIRYSDLGTNYESIWDRWDQGTKESHRGEVVGGQTWWQTVHTSVYDMESRTLRICVQETEDWYVFGLPGSAKDETDPKFAAWLATNPLDGCGTPDDYDTVKANAAAGAAAASQVEELGGQIQSAYLYSMGVYNYMSGNTNAWWSGTNYVFGADAATRTRFAWSPDMDAATVPCSMALWEIRDGVRQCVWDQRDWPTWYWNYVSAKFRQEVAASNAVLSAAITNRAPRAWSGTTAATGLDNPDRSTTWVDTPTLTLAPGMAWETVAHVGGCGYWGIVGDGTVIGGSGTNATLEIRDFEGKTVMRVIKGDSRLVYLECGSDIYTSGYDAQGRVTFTMRSDTQPVGEFSTVLDTALFVGEDNANCPVDYEWETVTPGAVYRCHFLVKSGIDADSCFARFKAMRNENTRIEYAADQVISGGLIYSGVKIAPVIPSNVSVGDTISWKVIAK